MYYTYIIYSLGIESYYCGSTQDLQNRLMEHNSGETRSIKHGCPWILIGFLVSNTRAEAMQKEKSIKGKGIKRWLNYSKSLLIEKL
jgi:putative endonuclease